MTREQQLLFCEKCINRKKDLSQGIICSLTGEKANFEDYCPDYKLDDTIIENDFEDIITFDSYDLTKKLSSEKLEKINNEQNFSRAIIFGTIAGILGSIIWCIITVTTGFKFGLIAIGIGALVGYTIRYIGKGIEQKFGFVAAIISLFSIILGNFLSVIAFTANELNLNTFDILLNFDYSYTFDVLIETFSIMDLVFYLFAIFESYKFAFREITSQNINEI